MMWKTNSLPEPWYECKNRSTFNGTYYVYLQKKSTNQGRNNYQLLHQLSHRNLNVDYGVGK